MQGDTHVDSMRGDADYVQGSMQGSAQNDTVQGDNRVDSTKGDNAIYDQGSIEGSLQGSVRADTYVDSIKGDAICEQGFIQGSVQNNNVQ
eukprot:10159625-Alexandrium_andersonii.AAC.1